MTRLVLLAGTMLLLYLPNMLSPTTGSRNGFIQGVKDTAPGSLLHVQTSSPVYSCSAMEALDLVKNRYASTFIKMDAGQADGSYYYKLSETELYLVYEGMDQAGNQYLIHLYEFVVDDENTGIGHTYTYGWYAVEPGTGFILDMTN